MVTRFLLDENLSPRLKAILLRYEPMMDILRVGDPDAPPLGTLDPEILLYLEEAHRLLITSNRVSMPQHIADHFAVGRHHWGVFHIRPHTPTGRLVEEVILLWTASVAEEWFDRTEWIPY